MEAVTVNKNSALRDNSAGQALFADKRILLTEDIPVYHFLDSAEFNGTTIHKVRVARNLTFNCKAVLKTRSKGDTLLIPNSLSDLIAFLDERYLADCRLVLDTDDKEVLSETIQQFLYLGIDLEVLLSQEETEIRKKECFTGLCRELKDILKETGERLNRYAAGRGMEEYRTAAADLLHTIDGMLDGMQERDLNVALMALKKSGKSVLVNCLLGDDYSPASIELPTYTTCVYKKSNNGKISLQYKDRIQYFDSPEAVRSCLLKEFKSQQRDPHTEPADETIDIRYRSKNGNSCSYTLIDTPGPDLAEKGHSESAYTWIKKADVVLFIIDYSKYLTSSEEEFFGMIKKAFEEHQKFYSFIVVVNKLDLMYLGEEKKSPLRFIDFLRSRLKNLGYRELVVFGVSALQYFYSLKALQIDKSGSLDTGDGKKLRKALDHCLLEYQGKDEMAVLSFLDNQIRNLLWFHGKEEATLSDLKGKSGVPHLLKYLTYIAREKAHIERFNHALTLLDKRLEEFRSTFLNDLRSRIEQEHNELEVVLQEVMRFTEEITTSIRQDFDIASLRGKIESDLNLAQRSLAKVFSMQTEHAVNEIVKILSSLSNEELVSFQKTGTLKAFDEMNFRVERAVIEKLYAPVLGKHRAQIIKDMTKREKRIEECKDRIQEKAAEVNRFLHTDYHLNCSELRLPQLSNAFTSFAFHAIALKPDTSFLQSLIKERLAQKRGLVDALLSALSFSLVQTRTGRLAFDEIVLKKALHLVRISLGSSAQEGAAELHEQLLAHVHHTLNEFEYHLLETVDSLTNDCRAVFDSFINDLNARKEETAMKKAFLAEIEAGIERFTLLWSKVRSAA